MRLTDCRLSLRISPAEQKRFLTLKEHGYSAREAFEIALNTPCDNTITVISKTTGEPIQFPRCLLAMRRKI